MRSSVLPLVLLAVGCTHDFDAFAPTDGGRDAAVTDTGTSPCSLPGAKSSGGHCYFPTAGALGWDEAKKACADAGAHLAAVTTSSEETFVESMTAGSDKWIGLSRPAGSPSRADSFQWVTGEAMTYFKWAPGEPSGSGECGRLKAGGAWADTACTMRFGAICESD